MGFLNKLRNVKERVETLIRDYPQLRDDDTRLMANIWKEELINPTTMTAEEFLRDFAKGYFTHPESIRRCRAKLQETDSSLRGESYKSKQKDGEEVKNNIHKL